MYLSPYFLEAHVRDHVERITQQRAECAPGGAPARRVARLRQRVGIALIAAGERIGGVNPRDHVTAEPQPAPRLSLGF